MFGMRRMLELLLQMNECACRLNQAFEIFRVVRGSRRVKPDLFQHIMCFVVTLLIPAAKKRAIIGMISNGPALALRFAGFELVHETRNPLAFVHEGRNLGAPAMMGKRARFSLREGERLHDRRRSEK